MKLSLRNGVYVLEYKDSNGKRVRKSLKTKDRLVAQQRARDELGKPDGSVEGKTNAAGWTLADALDYTYKAIWQYQKSWHSKQSVIVNVKKALGRMLVMNITYATLSDYVDSMRNKGLKPATINRRLAAISKALGEASKLGYIQSVPPIPKQPENNKRTTWITEGEEKELLARVDTVPDLRTRQLMEALLVFLLDTGARLGEALSIVPEHVSEDSVLFMDTKSTVDKPKHRRVPLTARALKAARIISHANATKSMLRDTQIDHRWRKIREAAGLPTLKLHDLRHTCASRLIQRGAQMHEVRDWLGHSTIVVTERYAHLADSSLSHLTGLLDKDSGQGETKKASVSHLSHFAKSR